MIRAARLVALVAACLAALASADPAAAGTTPECPRTSFLQFGDSFYEGVPVQSADMPAAGGRVGRGLVDRVRSGDDPCEREQAEVDVLAVEGVDPRVAVLVEGSSNTVFFLGNACAGAASGAERVACALSPLELDGRTYTGTSYPDTARGLSLGDPVGAGTLAGESVDVVAIVGVDPAYAVAVANEPLEAFVAPGVCPYSRFSEDPVFDNLRRCLEAPFGLLFLPPAAVPGTATSGKTDRPAPNGATVRLAQATISADVIPQEPAATAELGPVTVGSDGLGTISFDLPDLEPGRYEAVVTCDACAAEGGQREFAAGFVLVLEKPRGGGRLVWIALLGLFLVLAVASVVMYRRSRRGRGRAAPPGSVG